MHQLIKTDFIPNMFKTTALIFLFFTCFCISGQTGTLKSFSSADRDSHGDIACDSKGNLYMIVYNDKNARIIKTDSNGNVLWSKSDVNWYPASIIVSENTVYVSGSFNSGWNTGSFILISSGPRDMFVAAYDLTGSEKWIKTYGGNGSESAEKLTTDVNGNIYVAGVYGAAFPVDQINLPHSGENDIFILKFNAKGKPLWGKTIRGQFADELYGLKSNSKKTELYLSAYAQTSVSLGNNFYSGDNSNYILKTDSNGNTLNTVGKQEVYRFLGQAGGKYLMHSGQNYYDSSGIVYICDANMNTLDQKPVRKGFKSMLSHQNRIHIFGQEPLVKNFMIVYMGYVDTYDSNLNLIKHNELGIKASIGAGVIKGNTFAGLGVNRDTGFVYGHPLLAKPADQDVFLIILDEFRLGNSKVVIPSVLSAYPNPAGDYIRFTTTSKIDTPPAVSIIHSNGQIQNLETRSEDGFNFQLDISGIPAGIYTIYIKDTYQIFTFKFIKQ